nr:hypothetical protein TIFTF001_050385 [Ficus carica]
MEELVRLRLRKSNLEILAMFLEEREKKMLEMGVGMELRRNWGKGGLLSEEGFDRQRWKPWDRDLCLPRFHRRRRGLRAAFARRQVGQQVWASLGVQGDDGWSVVELPDFPSDYSGRR